MDLLVAAADRKHDSVHAQILNHLAVEIHEVGYAGGRPDGVGNELKTSKLPRR